MTTHDTGDEPSFRPVAGVLAVLVPGLGHAYLRQPGRAAGVAAGVLGLFASGVLIGGIDVVDRREDFVWFLGQAMVGPIAFGVDYVHQNHFKVKDGLAPNGRTARPAYVAPDGRLMDSETRHPKTGEMIPAPPTTPTPNSKSLGRMNEIGTLYATVAGMLNLIAIIDAAVPRRRPSATDSKGAPAGKGKPA